jgi:hypothetical protein
VPPGFSFKGGKGENLYFKCFRFLNRFI